MSCTTGSNFDYVRKTCDTPVKAVCLGATTTVATTTLGAGSSKKESFSFHHTIQVTQHKMIIL